MRAHHVFARYLQSQPSPRFVSCHETIQLVLPFTPGNDAGAQRCEGMLCVGSACLTSSDVLFAKINDATVAIPLHVDTNPQWHVIPDKADTYNNVHDCNSSISSPVLWVSKESSRWWPYFCTNSKYHEGYCNIHVCFFSRETYLWEREGLLLHPW